MRETDDEVFMTRSLKLSMLTPTTIEQNLIVHNGKKAAITNNNILHSRYCTAEANETDRKHRVTSLRHQIYLFQTVAARLVG